MQSEEMTATGFYTIKLLRSILNNTTPPEKPQNVSFEELLKFTKHHCVENMVCYAIEKLQEKPCPETLQLWRQYRDAAMFRGFQQENEQENLLTVFAAHHIRCMPLKGMAMKALYPQKDYRQMIDIDILVDEKAPQVMRGIMEARGYQAKTVNSGKDDLYIRPLFSMNVELHREIMDPEYKELYTYYQNIWEKARQEQPYRYVLERDDEWILMMLHCVKHYQTQGTGIRSMMDIEMFRRKYEKTLNWSYIHTELERAGADALCDQLMAIAKNWFSPEKDIEPNASEVTELLFSSGARGIVDHRITQGVVKQGGSLKYTLYRMFPPAEVMKSNYPFLKKCIVLLPAVWVYRWFYALCHAKSKVLHETKMVWSKRKK